MNLRKSERGQELVIHERDVSGIVIPRLLVMTRLGVEPSSYAGVSPYFSCKRRSMVRKIRPSTM